MSDRASPGVLIVDDQPDVLALLQTVLRHYGFAVFLAPTGQGAVELYRYHRSEITLVLLDVAMPGWDGPRTLRALRAVNPEVVCCFVTGAAPEGTEQDLRALGAARV